jgi:Fibronectin type III domain
VGLSARMVLVPTWGLRTCVALLAALTLAVGLSAVRPGPAGVRPTRIHSAASGLLALPVSARGAVSADLGQQDPRYRVHRVGSLGGGASLRAVNPGQHFSERFSPAGVTLGAGRAQFSLGLAGVGRGAHVVALPAVAARAAGNRVSYDRDGVREWYANGPLGLEQGFDVARRPGGSGVLTLAVSVSGASSVRLRDGSALLSGKGGSLRYSGLSASDAHGRALRAWLGVSGGRLVIRVDDRGARYPVRVDPFVQQGTLPGPNEIYDVPNEFITSIALSADGNTVLVGARSLNEHTGGAWVFTRSGEIWTQQGPELGVSELSGPAEFGTSVALSADGSTALIGAPRDDTAWVFTRSGETWTHNGQKLSGDPGSEFGVSVALSADGSTALIGAPLDEGGLGAAWVFIQSDGVWVQQGAKVSGTGDGAFGSCVSLSGDGNTAVIGNPSTDGDGSAEVLTRTSGTWSNGQELTASNETDLSDASFGSSVALSADGSAILVGAPYDESVWTFSVLDGTWSQVGPKLTADNVRCGQGVPCNSQNFGSSLYLSSDGTTALILGAGQGTARLFTRTGQVWTEESKIADGDGFGKGEGEDLAAKAGALSADGSTVLLTGHIFGFPTTEIFANEPPSPPPSSPSSPPPTGPEAPLDVTAVAGDGQATVSFVAPPNGGSPITSYTVVGHGIISPLAGKSSITTQTVSGSSPVVVRGLVNTDLYWFEVTATNGVGAGPSSAPSNTVVPLGHQADVFALGQERVGNGGAVVMKVYVSGRGVVRARQLATVANAAMIAKRASRRHRATAQALVGPAHSIAKGAGAVTLTLRPTTTARRILRRKGSVKDSILITFSPAEGSSSSQVTAVQLGAKSVVTPSPSVSSAPDSFTRYSFDSGLDGWESAWGDLTLETSATEHLSGERALQITVHSNSLSAVNAAGYGESLYSLKAGALIYMWVYRPASTPSVAIRPMVREGPSWTFCPGTPVKPPANTWYEIGMALTNCTGSSSATNLQIQDVGVQVEDKGGAANGKSFYLDDVSW